MMRLLLLLPALACLTTASAAGEKVYRLGKLAPSAASLEITRSVTLPELAKLGFEEGRNFVLEERVGDAEAVPGLARELLLTKPDAIYAIDANAIRAESEATTTVPIVMFGASPVSRQAVHPHPGGCRGIAHSAVSEPPKLYHRRPSFLGFNEHRRPAPLPAQGRPYEATAPVAWRQ
jgi:putative ABC transport system substrate-binding protein